MRLRERLEEQATHDALTGLFNRRYLDETLNHELKRAAHHRQSVGIILIDIDHFKRFNDTYGHDAGDRLLQAVAAFLQENTRGGDIACRYGGEEFIVVLPGAALESTVLRARQMQEGIKALQVEHYNQTLETITISLGMAIFPDHGVTSDTLIKAADVALYQAKAEGRDRVVVASTLV
jgi:diguanylate cyclase (GGDEF)-like protein